jgi:hypothetical protein
LTSCEHTPVLLQDVTSNNNLNQFVTISVKIPDVAEKTVASIEAEVQKLHSEVGLRT